MIEISDEQFEKLVAKAMDSLPSPMADISNVAITIADEPTEEQRIKQKLRQDQTLFGLYEGIPLTKRNNAYSGVLPDKITIFKLPICNFAETKDQLYEQVRHTLWHELAHHYGLGHGQIHELE